MAKTSTNLSDRIFFTVDWFDYTGYIGELYGEQKKLVKFSKKELKNFVKFVKEYLVDDVKGE